MWVIVSSNEDGYVRNIDSTYLYLECVLLLKFIINQNECW